MPNAASEVPASSAAREEQHPPSQPKKQQKMLDDASQVTQTAQTVITQNV